MTSWWDETVFNISFEELKINSVYLLRIHPTGEIKTSLNYYDEIKSHFITPNIAFNEIITTPPPTVGINKAELTDVKSLLKYVSPTSRAYFEDHFAKVGVKKPKGNVEAKASKFSCNDCSYECIKKTDILKHIVEHTEKPTRSKASKSKKAHRYSCNFCDVKTNSKQNLSKHIASSHTKSIEYKCTTCAKSFKYLKCMQSHENKCRK